MPVLPLKNIVYPACAVSLKMESHLKRLEKQTRAYKAVKCAEFSTGGLGTTFVNFSVLSDPRVQNS